MDTVVQPTEDHGRLATDLADRGVQYAVGTFVDIVGRAKSKVVPIGHLPHLLAGSERYTPRGMGELGQMTPHEDECVAMPDPSTLRVMPWDPRFAWMAADLLFGGTEPFAHCTRSMLKRQLARAAERGFAFNLGVETEIYAFRPGATGPDGYLAPIAASGSIDPTPAYDVESTLDAMPFLDPMVRYMNETGFGVFSFDHEGGDAQFEFDFEYAPALEMADKLTFFRLMAKQVAKQAGLEVTFMPKPYTAAWGSGHHFNMSLAERESGQNLFRDVDGPRGWSKICYGFVAGILRHAAAIAAIATPTVNSYKRLVPRLTDGCVSWAPVWAAYGDNNRSCMLRLPRNRPAVENRAVDSAANTYLAAAFLLAAGLEGIAEGLDPGDPVEDMTYDWTRRKDAVRLPRNLLEAIDAFEADPLTHEVFPAPFVSAYVEMKNAEWDDYHSRVSEWERDKYLTLF
ncbi:MAG: glutamine synthetase [Actinomycetota bacterium]|nr:glutamine synthetase [Actinomycetota bacterium]